MAYIRQLSPKILSTLYHQFMNVDPDGPLSIEEITAKIKIKADQNQIHAGLKYLTYRHYIQTTPETSYQITPDGIDYYENLMSSDAPEKSTITIGNNNNDSNGYIVANGTITIHRPKLSKTMRRRIFDILTQVGEVFQYLKKQNLLNKENEQKFKDWYSELENIIHYHNLEEVPSKKDRAYSGEDES